MGGIRSRPVDMSSESATFVKQVIAANPLVVFSKTRCPYCTLAKEVLNKYKASDCVIVSIFVHKDIFASTLCAV